MRSCHFLLFILPTRGSINAITLHSFGLKSEKEVNFSKNLKK